MRRWTPVLLVLVMLGIAGRQSLARDPDATQLAAAIDQQIESRLHREGLRPAELADDAEFLRRAYLDLNGVVPTRDQAPGVERPIPIVDTSKGVTVLKELL